MITKIRIPDRMFIEVKGKDTKAFLQGLCTNDVNKLVRKNDSIAASFLNTKGRIMADTILYYTPTVNPDGKPQTPENDVILIEVQSEMYKDLFNTMFIYKLRSKVKVTETKETLMELRFVLPMISTSTYYPTSILDSLPLNNMNDEIDKQVTINNSQMSDPQFTSDSIPGAETNGADKVVNSSPPLRPSDLPPTDDFASKPFDSTGGSTVEPCDVTTLPPVIVQPPSLVDSADPRLTGVIRSLLSYRGIEKPRDIHGN